MTRLSTCDKSGLAHARGIAPPLAARSLDGARVRASGAYGPEAAAGQGAGARATSGVGHRTLAPGKGETAAPQRRKTQAPAPALACARGWVGGWVGGEVRSTRSAGIAEVLVRANSPVQTSAAAPRIALPRAVRSMLALTFAFRRGLASRLSGAISGLLGKSPMAGDGGAVHTPVHARRKRASGDGAPDSLITSAKKRPRVDYDMSTPPPIMSPLVGDDETPEATLPAVAHTMLPTVEKKQRSRLSTLFSPVFNALGLVASGDEEKAVQLGAEAMLSPGVHVTTTSPASVATGEDGTPGDTATEAGGYVDVSAEPEVLEGELDDEDGAREDGEEQDEGQYEDDDYEDEGEFDPYYFIKCLPPVETITLPHPPLQNAPRTRRNKKMCLVLDLDETLVHSTMEAPGNEDFSFPVFFNNQSHQVYVRKRPHVMEFLTKVAKMFEVVVFTASAKVYAEQLLDILDPKKELIRQRVYRDSCVYVEGNYLKDLRVLGRDLSQLAIVDNSPQAFGFQIDNGIPIESWFDDMRDTALLELLPFLEKLAKAHDIRPLIRKHFKLHQVIKRSRPTARY